MLRDLRIARDLRVSPRTLWGWNPEQRLERDEHGWRIVSEPEWDKTQYEYMVALYEHEASLGEHGLPLDETMSPLADPDNPDRKYEFKVTTVRDFYDDALERAQNDPKYSGENFSRARKFRVEKTAL